MPRGFSPPVGWPGVLEDMREDELYAAEYTYSVQFEVVSEMLDWRDIYGPEESRDGSMSPLEFALRPLPGAFGPARLLAARCAGRDPTGRAPATA